MTAVKTTLPGADEPCGTTASGDAVEQDCAEPGVFVASHDILFLEAPSSSCDACGSSPSETDAADGYRIPGRGTYLWTRGDETRIESVPLCASCASAIGMTALARWEIEEEEG